MNKVKTRKKIHLIICIIVFSLYLILNAVMVFIYSKQPFGSNLKTTFLTITYISTIIVVLGVGFYFFIVFMPLNKYYLSIIDSLYGKKETTQVSILRFDDYVHDVKGAYYKSIDVLEWSEIKNNYVERNIIYDSNFVLNFNENQMVKVVTCGNKLIAYEVI